MTAPDPVADDRESLARVLSQVSAPSWWDGDTPTEEGVPADEDYVGADAVLCWLRRQRQDAVDDGAPDTTLTDAGHSHAPGIWCDECPDAEEKRAAVAAEAAQRGAKRCTCWTHVITRGCPVHDPDGRAAPTASEDTQHWCPQCPEKPTPEPVTADRARVIALTEDDRVSLIDALHKAQTDGIWPIYIAVERILDGRVAVRDGQLDRVRAEAWDEGWAVRAEYDERRDVPTDWPDLNPYRAALGEQP